MHLSSLSWAAGAAADDPCLTVCRDADVGLCVRALGAVAAGAVLESFDGDIGPHISQHSLQVRPGLHISGTRHIGYLSHGCDPNCRLDMTRFQLVALRAIAAGERLTIDYAATEDRLHVQFACACGAPSCRGWITGRDEPANGAGQDFLGARARASEAA